MKNMRDGFDVKFYKTQFGLPSTVNKRTFNEISLYGIQISLYILLYH